MTQFHFIAGLPRSGSTLLSAILRQNPSIHASISSPIHAIFNAVHRTVSGANEASNFLTNRQREAMLRSIFVEGYRDGPSIVFDTNRMWPAKMAVLTRLFPEAKFICCVRQVAWIVDSIERIIRANSFEASGIFGFEASGTVYSRAAGLTGPNGMISGALDALRDGYYSHEAEGRMILLEYEALAKNPAAVIEGLYGWLGLEPFEHDFNKIQQIPGAQQFDAKLGTPGLHAVRSSVKWVEREPVLPLELFNSFARPFWRQNPNRKVAVIHCDPQAAAATAPAEQLPPPPSDDQVARMIRNSQKMLEDTAALLPDGYEGDQT